MRVSHRRAREAPSGRSVVSWLSPERCGTVLSNLLILSLETGSRTTARRNVILWRQCLPHLGARKRIMFHPGASDLSLVVQAIHDAVHALHGSRVVGGTQAVNLVPRNARHKGRDADVERPFLAPDPVRNRLALENAAPAAADPVCYRRLMMATAPAGHVEKPSRSGTRQNEPLTGG